MSFLVICQSEHFINRLIYLIQYGKEIGFNLLKNSRVLPITLHQSRIILRN